MIERFKRVIALSSRGAHCFCLATFCTGMCGNQKQHTVEHVQLHLLCNSSNYCSIDEICKGELRVIKDGW